MEVVVLCIVSALVLLSYILMLLLPDEKAKYVVFPSVPLHLFLINALFSVGATLEVVALVFLVLLFLYVSAYAWLRSRKGKAERRERDDL